MAMVDVLNTKAHFREWNREEHTGCAEQSGEGEEGFASCLYENCLDLFKELYKESRISSSLSIEEQHHLKEQLGRLFLWGDGFGNRILDRILGRSSDLRTTVLGLIAGVGKVLTGKVLTIVCRSQQGGKIPEQARNLNMMIEKAESMIVDSSHGRDNDSDQDSDCDASDYSSSDIAEDISFYTTCLMELIPSMERTLSRMLSERPMEGPPPTVSFLVSEHASKYVRKIYDKFPGADIKLIERLGEATWRRRMYVRSRMGDVSSHTTTPQNEYPNVPEAGSTIYRPYSVLDYVLGTSLPPQSTYAASAASDDSLDASNADYLEERRSVRDVPPEVAAGKPFQCKICGKVLENITRSIPWKRHVLSDLQPYICTFPNCKAELKTYPTRTLWADHELSEHRVKKVWHCMECPDTFNEVELWRKHVESSHNISFSEAHFPIAAASREKDVPGLPKDTQCPMCLIPIGAMWETFVKHVGKHMEYIALRVVPLEMNFGTELEADFAEKDAYDACLKDGTGCITHQSGLGSDAGRVDPVESDQRAGVGLGAEQQTPCTPQAPSELRSHPSSNSRTDMIKPQPGRPQDFSLLPSPRSVYSEHAQNFDRGKRMIIKRLARICLQCRRRRMRCSGFEASELGPCNNCQKWNLECSFAPVTSQAQTSVPTHTAYPYLHNTESATEEYALNTTTPRPPFSYSIFVLQTRKPKTRWKKLADNTIVRSLAELFLCMLQNSQIVNIQVLRIKLQTEKITQTFLVKRNDTEGYEGFIRASKILLENQLRHSKDKNCTVDFYIEPIDAKEISIGFVGKQNEDQKDLQSLYSPGALNMLASTRGGQPEAGTETPGPPIPEKHWRLSPQPHQSWN